MTLYLLSSLAVLGNAFVATGGVDECSGEWCEVTSLIQKHHEVVTKSTRSVGETLSSDETELPVESAISFVAGSMYYSGWRHHPLTLLENGFSRFMSILETKPEIPSHPFPSLDWSEVRFPDAAICLVTLFLAGVLCSAGGIGGGGVYVTVLMVAGQLSPHDAVPLSKAVVFAGSMVSLALNLRKSLAKDASGGPATTLIDYNICRLVVPSALFGTLLGVLLNSQIAPSLIVALLVGILFCMTWMSCKQFFKAYYEEHCSRHGLGDSPRDGPSSTEASENMKPAQQEQRLTTEKIVSKDMQQVAGTSTSTSIRNILCNGEGIGSFALLVLVVCCGVLRAHGLACHQDLLHDVEGIYGRDACTRPLIRVLFHNQLLSWMTPQSTSSEILLNGTVLLPMMICLSVVLGYSCYLICREQWKVQQVLLYCLVAVLTGAFAGLVGIGGGLVFSPFILMMTGDPSIAVATSSTCVIFTSSSTTFQYLFTDRITMSLTIIYGIVNLLASYVGTSAVHMMDTLHNRKSVISGIVCLGVLASVVLSVYKLCSMGVSAPLH